MAELRGFLCVLFFASALLWAQAQDESVCGSTVPVLPLCENPLSEDDWLSELTAVEINLTSVTISWTLESLVSPINQSYEILFRRFTDPRHNWNVTTPLNFFDVTFDATNRVLSYTFESLQHNTTYEMRVCLSPAPNLSRNALSPLECGYCTLCFQTKNPSIRLLSATSEMRPDERIFTCEASSDPPSAIRWTGQMPENPRERFRLDNTNSDYTISSSVDLEAIPPVTISQLEYEPSEVDFANPDCFIENGFDTVLVRKSEFNEIVPTPTPISNEVNLVNARVEERGDGTSVYICEATSFTDLDFSWETTIDGSRVALSPNDPMAEYLIITTVNIDLSPIYGTSSIAYHSDYVEFPRPDCVVRNDAGSSLRIRASEFTVTEPTTTSTNMGGVVTLPVWGIALLVVLPFLIITGIIATTVSIRCMAIRRKKRRVAAIEKREMNEPNNYTASLPRKAAPSNDSSMVYVPLETTLPRHMIIPNSDIKVSTVIGQGEFGVVYKGTINRNNDRELVAVKTLKGIFATANDIQSFTEEILILLQFDHPNVMSLIGVCLGADKVGGGPSIILPFMSKGSLLNFLRKEAERLRPSKDADITQIGAVEKSLVQICLQVARGMEYLASQRFVHRDLAARNCMIDQDDQIKVGDFGLSEDVYAKNYFRQTSSDSVKLPVKWMALESLKLGVFSEKSDVWSYGVTCWEVFSCGEIPYSGVHPQAVLQLLEEGQRLRKPRNPACSNELYLELALCWEANPDRRKTFSQLCLLMETQLQSMSDYLDLNIIANHTPALEEDNPYDMANEVEEPQSENVVHDYHDSTSVDMLYRVPEDDAYIGV